MALTTLINRFSGLNIFEIDFGAVARCVRQVRDYNGSDIHFFATLKANAYGYGLIPTVKVVVASGADGSAVR